MEQRRFFDASNLKEDVITPSAAIYDHVPALWSPTRSGREEQEIDLSGKPLGADKSGADPSVSLRHVILDLQRKIDAGALKGVQIEYFDLVSRRCIALCRGEREKALGVIDSGFTLTGPEGDDLSLRVLISFPVGPIGNQSESANLMPHFGLVPRGPKLARLSGAKIDHISRSLQRLCANNQLPVVTLLEHCLRFVTQELTLAMNKQLEALKLSRLQVAQREAKQAPARTKNELFRLEIAQEEKKERAAEPKASVAARQPCPAYCGARFSGGGHLVHFDNFNDLVHVQIWKAGSVGRAADDTSELSFPRTYAELKERIEVAKHAMLGRSTKREVGGADEHFGGFSPGGISVDASGVKLSPRKSRSPRSNDSASGDKKLSDSGSVSNVVVSDELNESDLFDWHFEPDRDNTSAPQTPEQTQSSEQGEAQAEAKIEAHAPLDLDLDVYSSMASEFNSRETSVTAPVVTLFTLAGTTLQRYLAESYAFGTLSCRYQHTSLQHRRSSYTFRNQAEALSDLSLYKVFAVDGAYDAETFIPKERERSSAEARESVFAAPSAECTPWRNHPLPVVITQREHALLRYFTTLPDDDYGTGGMSTGSQSSTPAVHNHRVASVARKSDLLMLWTTLQLITDDRVAMRETASGAGLGTLWAYHPCGRQLITELFSYYSKKRDVQTLATIACVIEDLQHGNAWSGTEPLVDPKWRSMCDRYKRGYADVLQRMGYYIRRAEVLKYLTTATQPTTAGRDKSSKSTFLSISTANEPFLCSVCQVRVNGLVTFCKECSHGGHSHHMNEWFHEFESCPTGCGCLCSRSIL